MLLVQFLSLWSYLQFCITVSKTLVHVLRVNYFDHLQISMRFTRNHVSLMWKYILIHPSHIYCVDLWIYTLFPTHLLPIHLMHIITLLCLGLGCIALEALQHLLSVGHYRSLRQTRYDNFCMEYLLQVISICFCPDAWWFLSQYGLEYGPLCQAWLCDLLHALLAYDREMFISMTGYCFLKTIFLVQSAHTGHWCMSLLGSDQWTASSFSRVAYIMFPFVQGGSINTSPDQIFIVREVPYWWQKMI
jgi:hypothetical protein